MGVAYMLKAFTRNYEDNSTEAGYQFTFYCDICNDGFKSTFIESSTYKTGRSMRMLGEGASVLGNLMGGRARNLAYTAQRSSNILSERFNGRSPQWQREHEEAFVSAQEEARPHFRKCPNCNKYVCHSCWNEDEGLCVNCAPRQDVYIAKARAEAMKRNIDEAGQGATVWQGEIESKTTICPVCHSPAGKGKFCSNCGASLELRTCPNCQSKLAVGVKFCGECGYKL